METTLDLTSDTQAGTHETIGSSELNADEAEAITRSMDMSIEFWGHSQDPPERIPASRLKCPLQRTGKASCVALKIWEKMSQTELDKVKDIEGALMREGEIGTIDLMNSLRSIVEGIGMEFEDIIRCVHNDPIESTISLTNEILHIFNQNEPPEIMEEDEYGSFIPFQPVDTHHRRSERQRKEMTNKIKFLMNKAHKLGLTDIKVPSSPYLTERSKLSLVEKQVRAKLKLRNVQQAFRRKDQNMSDSSISNPKLDQPYSYSKKKISSHQRREAKRSSLADRPKFRTAVKADTLRYEDLIKHAPDLSKRMKRVHEIRRKFLEKTKNGMEGKSSINACNTRSHHFASPFNFNSYNQSFKGISPKPRKRFHISRMSDCCLRKYNSDESISNTKINITIENSDDVPQTSKLNRRERPPSREDMLLEMKKMLKEAVQEVATSNALNRPVSLFGNKKKLLKNNEMTINHTQEYEHNGLMSSVHKTYNEGSEVYADKDDTVVTVTQEASSPYRQIVNNKDENKVSTEVKVSNSYGGQGLKVSVISKLSGQETESEVFPRPKSRHDVKEAINILREYIALNNNEELMQGSNEESEKEEDKSLLTSSIIASEETGNEQSITSQTITTTEVFIEPDDHPDREIIVKETDIQPNEVSVMENDTCSDSSLSTVQAYTVTMLLPLTAPEELRHYSPFQIGGVLLNNPYSRWMVDEVGDVGDRGWSSWNSSGWRHGGPDNSFFPIVRSESDSLYVNASEDRLYQYLLAEDSSSVQSHHSTTSSIVAVRNEEEPSRNSFSAISKSVFGIFRYLMNSVLGTFLKTFNIIKSVRSAPDNNDNLSLQD